jgi:multiple sugar transport system permease protein
MEKQKKYNVVFIYIFLIAGILIFNFPIIWTLISSFKPSEFILSSEPVWLFRPTLEHYSELFADRTTFDFWLYFRNSLIISVSATVLSILLGFTAAYSFSRFKTGGGNLLFLVLSQRMLPPIIFIIPIAILFNIYHLIDRHIGVILIYLTFNIPFATLVIKSFIDDIPMDLEYSAYLDRYSKFDVMYKIIFPLTRSGIVAVAVICFIFSWNEFLFTLILTFIKAPTLTVGAAKFVTGYGVQWGKIAAASIISIIPTLAVGLLGQKYLVRGLTLGAVK